MWSWILGAAIGFLSGVLSGAFGIGGGIVTTPAIRLLMGAPALIAVGTPLPVIIPSAITGAVSYGRQGLVDARAGVVVGISGSLTAIAGAAAASRVGGEVVLLGTALLIFYAAADTILQVVRSGQPSTDGSDAVGPALGTRSGLAPLVGIGLLAGLYSGFFGLGGGFVLVPMLTRWVRLPIKRAIGTSLVAVGLLAIPGTFAHALLGNIDWIIAGGLVVGAVPGALLGARFTMGARDREVRIGFAAMLVAAGAWLAVTEIAKLVR